jgi:quercetin dioxygenase-like cupin family protein
LAIGNPFIDWDAIEAQHLSPGVRIRTPHGRHVMLSLVEIDTGWTVPTHHHPHEQAGLVLEGRMRFTIGPESRVLGPGQSYIVPPDVPHSAEAVDGPVRALDIFSPIREDYAQRTNRYIAGENMKK